ncbi:tripartite ATP-independent transporter DctP family solute receptor [Fusobacterium naviforme]|nr:TRAP transporter substrate-binding protein [Fusobacterium naviforme]PSL10144.1 tripartite ATP-independent transporter DctP family solute receptor [Fusobacterium naviforme]STO27553.1 Neu5Ac-binding protein [Fusobacterium naviforme]
MKKNLFLVLTASMLAMSLSACGGGSATVTIAAQSSGEATGTAAEESKEVEANISTADTSHASVTIKYSTWANDGEAAYEGMEMFKKLVEEGSEGNIAVELYPANQLGSTNEQVEQITMNQIQMMSSGDPGVKELEYLCLPYLFTDLSQYEEFLSSDLGKKYIQKSIDDRDALILDTLPRSPRIISSNIPINSLQDMKNMKIRVPERDYYVETFKALGTQPTAMDMGEVYSAMQTGVVEGQENPIETIVSYGFQNVNKYLVYSNHMIKPAFVIVSNSFFNSLTPDQQTLVRESCEKAREYATDYMEDAMKKDRQTCIDAGMEICEPDLEEFKAATQSVRDELGEQIWGKEGYEFVKSIAEK